MSLILISLFLISRILLINSQAIFFDSYEYLHLFRNPDYFVALGLGHSPPHVGYILLFWPLYQLFRSAPFILLAQTVLSLFTILAFYQVVKYLTGDRRAALMSAVIASLLPLFWISGISLIMEISYVSFYVLSLFFLVRKKTGMSALFLAMSLLTHPLVMFWLPLYLYLIYFYDRTALKKYVFAVVIIYSFVAFLNLINVSFTLHRPVYDTFRLLYLSKFGEHAVLSFGFTGLLITLRNFIIPLVYNNSLLLVILSLLGLLKNKKYLFIGLLWVIPAFFTNQWWDSLLNGRHSLLAGFGLAFSTALLIYRNRFVSALVITYIIAFSLPAVSLLYENIPYLQEQQFASSLPAGSLLIDTHFAQPQLDEVIIINKLYVNYPLTSKNAIKTNIDNYLKLNKPVFISSGALSEPYGLYSGPFLHNITLSYAHPYELSAVIPHYTLQKIKVINQRDNLIIYQVISSSPSAYPVVPHLNNSPRTINSRDLLFNYIFRRR